MACLKTRIPDSFLPMPDIPFCVYRKYRPEHIEVETLLDLCSHVCDSISEPTYFYSTPEEIAAWILEGTDHPEYREAFIKNGINGKAVIFLEADKFPRINIRTFDVIKELAAKIRQLSGTDQDEFKRSISLPIRKPQTLYLWYKTKHTGPTSYYMTPMKYFKIIHIIPEEEACGRSYYQLLNHWNRIPTYMPWCPHIMVGGSRRINPMTGTTQRQIFNLKDRPHLLKDYALCMYKMSNDFQFPVGREVKVSISLEEKASNDVKCELEVPACECV